MMCKYYKKHEYAITRSTKAYYKKHESLLQKARKLVAALLQEARKAITEIFSVILLSL